MHSAIAVSVELHALYLASLPEVESHISDDWVLFGITSKLKSRYFMSSTRVFAPCTTEYGHKPGHIVGRIPSGRPMDWAIDHFLFSDVQTSIMIRSVNGSRSRGPCAGGYTSCIPLPLTAEPACTHLWIILSP